MNLIEGAILGVVISVGFLALCIAVGVGLLCFTIAVVDAWGNWWGK